MNHGILAPSEGQAQSRGVMSFHLLELKHTSRNVGFCSDATITAVALDFTPAKAGCPLTRYVHVQCCILAENTTFIAFFICLTAFP